MALRRCSPDFSSKLLCTKYRHLLGRSSVPWERFTILSCSVSSPFHRKARQSHLLVAFFPFLLCLSLEIISRPRGVVKLLPLAHRNKAPVHPKVQVECDVPAPGSQPQNTCSAHGHISPHVLCHAQKSFTCQLDGGHSTWWQLQAEWEMPGSTLGMKPDTAAHSQCLNSVLLLEISIPFFKPIYFREHLSCWCNQRASCAHVNKPRGKFHAMFPPYTLCSAPFSSQWQLGPRQSLLFMWKYVVFLARFPKNMRIMRSCSPCDLQCL